MHVVIAPVDLLIGTSLLILMLRSNSKIPRMTYLFVGLQLLAAVSYVFLDIISMLIDENKPDVRAVVQGTLLWCVIFAYQVDFLIAFKYLTSVFRIFYPKSVIFIQIV